MSTKIRCALFLLSIAIYSSCNSGIISNNSESLKISNNVDSLNNLLSLFPTITAANLHIYSPFDSTSGNKFAGKAIDSTFYRYFSSQPWLDSTDKDSKIFACFQFNISNTRTGLIIRRRSQYSETAIDLCLWDNHSKKIINEMEVSDNFGDGQWYFVKDAWLVDINKDGLLDIVTRQKDWDGDDTTKPEGITTDSLKIYIAKGDNFNKALYPVDTTIFKILNWDN
jgi:hypothetical protein